ncbi:MAG: Mce-associated rane protein [Mycobacterium sp.]|nr:Mce-associated rane protein [Mycobacterium sp.]
MIVDSERDAGLDAARTDSGGSVSEDDTPIEESASSDEPQGKKSKRVQLSVSLRSVVIAVVVTALLAAVGVLAWLYIGAQGRLDEQARQSENNVHAEKVALQYAGEAAAMNYQDLNAWKGRLVAGTSPELKDKLSKAATSMEQILVPLQWNSTAHPLAAKVRTETGGVYVVDAFVSVLTKTAQASEPLQSTATYSVTIDSTKDWQITNVGGVGDALEPK